ncbi:MAG TPA: ATP-binding protein [Tepidisphaeraceae bacterium]|nr:ATP-binding protein [Tepidisphaeraceae bacterium]
MSSCSSWLTKKIVLTGGPGAGKSVIAAEIVRRDARFVLVPEAATQVYTTLGTTWDRLDLANRKEAQRMIYRLQVQQETRIAGENPGKYLLLDRGTIDGATYWPDGPDAYWADLGSSLEQELARYDQVIWLETAAALGIYDGAASNTVRFEDAAAAVASGESLLSLWSGHSQFHRVAAHHELPKKVAAVEQLLLDVIRWTKEAATQTRWECRYSSCEMMYLEIDGKPGVRMYLHHSPASADRYSFQDVLDGKLDAEVRNLFGEETLKSLKRAVKHRMR